MEFFQLHHPLNVTVLCDRKGCEQVADYLEVDDHGQEYRVCAMHTDSKTHSSRLPTRKPSPVRPTNRNHPVIAILACPEIQKWLPTVPRNL
jgi:hypothetical protein